METLSKLGVQLQAGLDAAHKYSLRLTANKKQQTKIHVVGAGRALTAAYEQLRNAAENTEEHLLLQNAIRRFYRQIVIVRDVKLLGRSAEELATELTLAGYVANDSLTHQQLKQINELGESCVPLLDSLRTSGIHSEQAASWVLDIISVGVERVLNDHTTDDIFLQFCYDYFIESIDAKELFGKKPPKDYGVALLVALHRALLRSDAAVIRSDLMNRYQVTPKQTKEFIALSRRVDELMHSSLSEKIYHLVDKQAAPERIIRRMLSENILVHELLGNKRRFNIAYESQVRHEYKQTGSRIRRMIIRSIIFLFITKAVVGVALEAPYDLWVHGEVLWLPLVVNLLFPPLYMALLSLTLGLPGSANTRALIDTVNGVLYEDDSRAVLRPVGMGNGPRAKVFSVSYSIFAMLLIVVISLGLIAIGFSLLHLFIFFVFLSTASFLGFRLSRLIRELEVMATNQGGVTFVRDLFYLPFVVIGRWLNEKYSQINVAALVLDMLIELPLKTVLRLMRQWAALINAAKDEI